MTTAEWMRQSLIAARDTDAAPDARSKLASVSAAVAYSYPIADIDEVLLEIERGYLGESRRTARP